MEEKMVQEPLLAPLQEAIDALPTLVFENASPTEATPTALQILSRQSERHTKQLFRLNASYAELSQQNERLAELGDQLKRVTEESEKVRRERRQIAMASIQMMDALDWVFESLTEQNQSFASEVDSARRDCLRRLAGSGISEIPVGSAFDDTLHEGVGTVPANEDQSAYQVVRVVRRGFQMGSEILRRAEVITTI